MDVFNLSSMNNMSGLMSQMPPLPVAINDKLSATLLSNSTLVSLYAALSSLKWFL